MHSRRRPQRARSLIPTEVVRVAEEAAYRRAQELLGNTPTTTGGHVSPDTRVDDRLVMMAAKKRKNLTRLTPLGTRSRIGNTTLIRTREG